MAFDPPVFDAQGCTEVMSTELNGKWLFSSATNQQGRVIKKYWLGRNFNPNGLIGPDPIPPVENNYVGINTAEPTSVLDVHIPENLNANPLYGLTVSTGSQCSKVGLVAGDHSPSWVGSYNYGENGSFPFQVRAGNYGTFWNPSTGTFIHLNPSNERIGINTATPAATLDVNGDAKADNLKLTQVPEGLVGINGSGFISPATKSQIATLLTNGGTENNIAAFDTDGGLKNSYIKQGLLTSGSRSIGFKFDESLKTHFHFSKWQTLHADGGTSQFAYNSYTHWDGTNWVSEKVEPTIGASTMIQTNDGTIYFRNLKATENPATDWKTLLTMTPDRNVGIGTTPHSTSKLQVLGNVWIQDQAGQTGVSLRIGNWHPNQTSGHQNANLICSGKGVFQSLFVLNPNEWDQWPDFVFAKNYKLPSLKETEQFIEKEQHLPGVPTAKEVSEKGIDLLEMNRILLQKVEEMTLHLIRLEKEVEALKTQK